MFARRLQDRIALHGTLCVGIDPAAISLARCGLPDTADGALEFGRRVLESVDYQLSVVKPQSAYFERFGSLGMRALEELVSLARRRDVLVLLDAKRGDIDTTGTAYAEAYFSSVSSLRVDAITFSPYMGFAALSQAIATTLEADGGVFVVVRSSNPEGELLQTARQIDGLTVAESLSQSITEMNRAYSSDSIGSVGAVVGATCHDFARTVDALPKSFILAPGVGAQGATIAELRARFPTDFGRVLPSVSRAILTMGGSQSDIATTIKFLRNQTHAN